MRADLRSSERHMLFAAAAGAVASLALALIDPAAALTGWLGAAAAFAAIPAGSLCLLAMMTLIPGVWGEALRLTCEAGTLLALPALLAFVPVLLGMGVIYPWMIHGPQTPFQSVWLGPLPFALRTMLWFALLWSASGAIRARHRTRAVAAGALVAFPVLGSLVAIDWLMSLDLKLASSAFGLQILILSVTLAFAVLLLFRITLGGRPYRVGVSGGLLLCLLLMWAYIQFLTFFILWSPGLPDGAAWYGRRAGGWDAAEWAFALLGGWPLLALLLARFRRNAAWLARLCISVIAGKLIEFAWFALPGSGPLAVASFALAAAALASVTAVGLAVAMRRRIGTRAPA